MKGGFRKFSKRIGRWFTGEEEEFDLDFDIPGDDGPPRPDDRPAAAPTPAAPPPDQLAALEASLTRLASKGLSQVAGKVQLLRFDGLRERLGERWDQIGMRIDAIIQRSIRQYLAEKDIFSPFGEYGYLIVFAALTRDEAAMKCALIREEILKQLLGEEISSEDVVIETAVATVEGKIELRPLENLNTLFERIQRQEGVATEPASADDGPRLVEEAGRAPRGPTWGAGTEAAVEEAADPEWQADTADPETIRARLEGLDIAFRPLWDVRNKALVAFAAVPARYRASGETVLGDAAIAGVAGVERLAVDVEMLRRTLQAMVKRPEGSRVIAAVHFDSLASVRNRRQFTAACGDISDADRPDLVFELVGLPEGIPNARLRDLVVALGKLGGGVLVRCPMAWTDFAEFSGMGIDWMGFAPDDPHMDENRIMDAMHGFFGGAEAAGVPSYAVGLPSRNMATAAVGFGVRYLGGAVVPLIADLPEALGRFDLETLHGTRLIS